MSEKAPIVPNKRLQQTQAQVNEVVGIMRVNVDKVLERDKNLSELDGRAGKHLPVVYTAALIRCSPLRLVHFGD